MTEEPSEHCSYEVLRRVRWPNGVICVCCESRRVTTHSRCARTPRRRYLCVSCRRTFSDLTGTPFARTNLPLSKWLICLRLMRHGYKTSELAKALSVKWDTTAYMQRRLKTALTCSDLVQQLQETLQVRRIRIGIKALER